MANKLLGRPAAGSASRASQPAAEKPQAADAQTPEAVGYMPPAVIMKKLVRRQKGADGKDMVTMSVHTFHKLLEAALVAVFDEKSYLEKFADIRSAVKARTIPTGLRHFVTDGYFEARAPLKYAVDEAWYLKTYPDVALAIKSGKVNDGTHHFEVFGFGEGRVPNKDFQRIVAEWRELEKKHAMDG